MVGRRRAVTAFRPSAPVAAVRAPSRRQTAAMLVGVLVVATAIAVASFAVKPSKARSFDLFYGSVFVDDNVSPVAIDLSSGKATVRLNDASSAVSAERTQDLDMIPLDGGTLMLDPTTGEFNMLDSSGFVVKATGGGVRLPQLDGSSASLTTAVPAGDSAYLVRPSATGTAVYLVGQSTVAAAVGTSTAVKARASADLKQPSVESPDIMTAANGQLWLLAGAAGGSRQITQLSVPAGSNAGVALTVKARADVSGQAAISSATVNSDGTGGDAVGVASENRIRIFAPDGSHHDVSVTPPDGLQAIVPVHNGSGALFFLYQGSDAWSLVRAPVKNGAAESHTVDGLDATMGVVTPVASNGSVYTIERDARGTVAKMLRIGADGAAGPVPGLDGVSGLKADGTYPILHNERLNLTGAEVTSDGSRVIFDSRGNLKAVVVFTDDSHAARVVDKHSAVQVDTNGVASVTDKPHKDPSKKPSKTGKKPKPQPHPEQAINNKINCKVASQTPHIPTVHLVQRAARSVQLQWDYPLLDPQDCDPSTYVVSIETLTAGRPSPSPGQVTVQGQDGVNLIGLFPDTQYRMIVSAYINKLHTPSPPIEVTTSVEGPPAPTNVHTSVDDAGNWTVSWNSCGGLTNRCVATADWQIVPHLCDGVGLTATPDTRRRVGDPSQHSFSFTYEGSDTLLGRGMSFDIQGIGTKGTVGDTAGDGSCSYSWTPPVPSAISLHASAPPVTSSGSATSATTVSVDFAGSQVHDLGGVGGEITYELLLDGAVVGKVGPTSHTSAKLPGILPGRQYQATVIVNPARHPDASARLTPIPVKAAVARWPTPTISTSFNPTDAYDGTLTVTVGLPSGTNNHGETFDLTSDSRLQCGNTATGLSRTNISAGQTMSFGGIDRTQYNSRSAPCRVTVGLVQNSGTITDPPLYGDGTSSPRAAQGVTIDVPSLTAGQGDFYANWNSSAPFGQPQVNIGYSGGDSRFLDHASNWVLRVSNDGGSTNCGRSETSLSDSNRAQTLNIDKSCIRNGGNFTAVVSFSFYGSSHSYTVSVSGTAPSPIDPAKMSFTASFDRPLLGRSRVFIEYNGSTYHQDDLNSLHWSYRVTSDLTPNLNCMADSSFDEAPYEGGHGPGIEINFERCPPVSSDGTSTTDATYTVVIHFVDPNYGAVGDYPTHVDGTPK